MDFVEFARAHGLVLRDAPPIGRWVRVPTVTHPHKRNGAIKYLGDHGFVQDHASMQEVAVWQGERSKVDVVAARKAARDEQARLQAARRDAARKAQWIISRTAMATHPYLERKGFPELQGMVWSRGEARLLVVPMRIEGEICGVQLISEDGTKKFLTGQATRGATFALGQGPRVYCEGYATALSVQKAAAQARLKVQVVVTFSAHNMQLLAKDGWVIADNDESFAGELAAKATGRPYWISPQVGEDFNEFAQRVGSFRASQEVGKLVRAGVA